MGSDAELWHRAVNGDRDAFAVFYQRRNHKVFTHCYRRSGSIHDSEDLTAEVFAIAWRKRSTIVPDAEADILPWLLTTANNLLRHHHRSVRRARDLLAEIPREGEVPDIADAIADEAQRSGAVAAVLAVLDRLRLPDREIIELCVVQGLSPASIAAVSGKPPGTVRARLSRALERARKLYEAYGSDPDGGVR